MLGVTKLRSNVDGSPVVIRRPPIATPSIAPSPTTGNPAPTYIPFYDPFRNVDFSKDVAKSSAEERGENVTSDSGALGPGPSVPVLPPAAPALDRDGINPLFLALGAFLLLRGF